MKAAMEQQAAAATNHAPLPDSTAFPPLRLADVPQTNGGTHAAIAITPDQFETLCATIEELTAHVHAMNATERHAFEAALVARFKSRRFLLTLGAVIAAAIGWATGTATAGEALLTIAGTVVTFVAADTAQQVHAAGVDGQVTVARHPTPPTA